MAETNGSGTNSRLDPLEAMAELMIRDHEEFRDEHKRLLTAQVVMQDALQKLALAQTASEEKLNVLITTVDDWMRRQDRQ